MTKQDRDDGMHMKDRKHRTYNYNRKKVVITVLIIGILGCSGGLLARYRSELNRQTEMLAADFHFSSDYLEENQPTYSITDWTEDITLELYNYEKENPALVSELAVEYEVMVSSGQYEVENGKGKLEPGNSNEKNPAQVIIRPKAGTGDRDKEFTVTVNTKPYNEKLSAKFVLTGKQNPEVVVTNNNTHYTAKVSSNHYSGNVTLTWAGGLIPDAANDIVQKWNKGTFNVEPFHTYEIIFFNPSDVSDAGIQLTAGEVQ